MALEERNERTLSPRVVIVALLLVAIIVYSLVVIWGKLPDGRSTLADRTTLLAVVSSYYKQTGEVPDDVDDLMEQYRKLDYKLPR
ncbi:MAG: hypothetical protein IH944_04670 [Armatimonadetes bacterium]|nr:hypothetical protein [Armatimonadota bacterium]